MTNQCEFCENKFATVANLIQHQKTAKYCLEIQAKLNKNSIITQYECKSSKCKYKTHRQYNYERHIEQCKYLKQDKKDNYEKDLLKYKKRCKKYKKKLLNNESYLSTKLAEVQKTHDDLRIKCNDLEDERDTLLNEIDALKQNVASLRESLANDEGQIKVYKEVIDKPKTINNNTNNIINPKLLDIPIDTIRPFTLETVRETLEDGGYTYEMFVNGVRGLAEFVTGIIIDNKTKKITNGEGSDDEMIDDIVPERNYVCTDSSRNKFHRLLESKDWKADNGAKFLSKMLNELKKDVDIYRQQIINRMTDPKSDEEDREYADKLLRMTSELYFGITRPKSSERDKLFKKLRTKIKSIAAI